MVAWPAQSYPLCCHPHIPVGCFSNLHLNRLPATFPPYLALCPPQHCAGVEMQGRRRAGRLGREQRQTRSYALCRPQRALLALISTYEAYELWLQPAQCGIARELTGKSATATPESARLHGVWRRSLWPTLLTAGRNGPFFPADLQSTDLARARSRTGRWRTLTAAAACCPWIAVQTETTQMGFDVEPRVRPHPLLPRFEASGM